jgi:hypothetical protein
MAEAHYICGTIFYGERANGATGYAVQVSDTTMLKNDTKAGYKKIKLYQNKRLLWLLKPIIFKVLIISMLMNY